MDATEEQNLQPQACDRCWKRKQKCDRKSPQCNNCDKAGIQCIPRLRGRALDSHSNETSSDISPGSFIHHITKRIAFLESQLSSAIETGSPLPKSPAVASAKAVSRQTHEDGGSPHAQSIDNTVHEVQYLSLSAMSGPDRQDQGLWKSPNFATFTREANKLSGRNPGLSALELESNVDNCSLTLREIEDYLRTHDANDLKYYIDNYCLFSRVDYPCVTRQECIRALEAVSQTEVDASAGQLIQTLPEEITTSAIAIALGTIWSHSKAVRVAIQAKCSHIYRHFLPVLAEQDTDHVTVQCLTMQAVLSLYDPSAGPTWYLVGLAMTKAISIGMHRQQPATEEYNDDEEVEVDSQPKTLFWILYTLDRAIAFTMDRPLSIEDSDITLEIPEAIVQTLNTSRDVALTSLHLWTIHHAELLSRWHRDPRANLSAYLSSYQYWRSTCREILDRAYLRDNDSRQAHTTADIDLAFLGHLHKHETQLACRALVQLCIIGDEKGFSVQTHEKCKAFVDLEVPRFLLSLKACIDHGISVTFLDAYDTFAAAVVYVYCQQPPINPQGLLNSETSNRVFGIGVSGLRVIMTAMEIVQKVSELFPPILGLKEILWTFLSALEKSKSIAQSVLQVSTSNSSNEAIQVLEAEVQRCSIQVPDHLLKLMKSSLRVA